MSLFELLALVITMTAVFSVLSESLFSLPKVIGPMIAAFMLSLGMIGYAAISTDVDRDFFSHWLLQFDFSTFVLDGLLGLLLFAGALHMPVKLLEQQSRVIFSLAIFATLISTGVVGGLFWLVSEWFDLGVNIWVALVFGALISPTDPVAVLALLKNMDLPERLETIISGESLFNDAVGVVVFTVLTQIAFNNETDVGSLSIHVLGMEVGGGLLVGFVLGQLACLLIRSSNDEATQALITLAVASGGYVAALKLGVSGPIAMVVAGIIVGNIRARGHDGETAKEHINIFWNIIDDVLNAVLFVLIGMQLLQLPIATSLWLMPLAIVLSLLGRFVGVTIPTLVLNPTKQYAKKVTWDLIAMLTWGGLRGGVSVALVLTLPPSPMRDQLQVMTYAIVIFSVIVQGLSMSKVFSKKEFLAIDKSL
ncbi:Na(+)/H(+) antiporter NhaP [BD1-7 clade bacterium]|uniref:Na(+)/H(+) antiporter NhaP n=1 Tax=BD1-7 clade bacterium TaxID=2029982 RepID=A0A5S9QZY0_9GAMM|nr:Na(+)/H(+) antiporter NhaP [BD1-7 clade bacterium]